MLNEKASKEFGGMCKSVKSKKTIGKESDKCCAYDKNYHYPSGAGMEHSFEGGSGSEQHKEAPSYHNKVSK